MLSSCLENVLLVLKFNLFLEKYSYADVAKYINYMVYICRQKCSNRSCHPIRRHILELNCFRLLAAYVLVALHNIEEVPICFSVSIQREKVYQENFHCISCKPLHTQAFQSELRCLGRLSSSCLHVITLQPPSVYWSNQMIVSMCIRKNVMMS